MTTRKKQSQKPTPSTSTTKTSARAGNAKVKSQVKNKQNLKSYKGNNSKNASQSKSSQRTSTKTTAKSNARATKKQTIAAEPVVPAEQVEMDYRFDTDLHHGADVAEMMSERYVGLNVFFVLMVLLASAILWTGVKASMQIQQYREDYKTLQEMKHEYLQLQIEHKRLLIEQQTFSSTPQIATRAISKLNMYFPTFDDKRILQPQAMQSKQPSKLSQANSQNRPQDQSQNSISNLYQSAEVSQ